MRKYKIKIIKMHLDRLQLEMKIKKEHYQDTKMSLNIIMIKDIKLLMMIISVKNLIEHKIHGKISII